MKTDIIKGFQDFTGDEAEKRTQIKKIITQTFQLYGFEPSETPIIESEEFVRGDNSQDEAVSDIFKFQDKGKRKLALRYELTFPLKRIAKNKKLPYKTYRIGDVFRDEPISSNRFRQFTQCDIDIIGSTIKQEAEILTLAYEIMQKLGIKQNIYINNRNLLNEILESQDVNKKDINQVLREIDKLDKLPEAEIKNNLKKYNAENILTILKKPESYFKKYNAYDEILELKKYCTLYKIKVIFKPTLVRGLSYYNGSIFETNALAGGSYKINNIQSTGISFGLERISALTKIKPEKPEYIIVSINRDKEAINLAQKLRQKNKQCTLMFDKLTKALEYANSKQIQKLIIAGEKEAPNFLLRDMKTGKEKIVNQNKLI